MTKYIYVVLIFMVILSTREFFNLKKQEAYTIYGHEKKSLLDAYIINLIALGMFFAGSGFAYLLSLMEYEFENETSYNPIVFWTKSIAIIASTVFMAAVGTYLFSEIKHISLDDSVGNRNKGNKHARAFFVRESMIGLVSYLSVLVYTLLNDWIVACCYFLFTAFFFFFGMADLLQHKDYNSAKHRDEVKKMKFKERFFCDKLMSFFTDVKCREPALKNYKYNVRNIAKGLKEIVCPSW